MPRLIDPDPPGLPLLVTRAQALDAGITDGRLRHLIRSRRWTPVGRGTYLRQDAAELRHVPAHGNARMRHLLSAEAAAARREGAVIGMASAAIVHGLPLVTGTPPETCLLVPPGGWSGRRGGIRSQIAGRLEEDSVQLDGSTGGSVMVTSVPRTWVDIARTCPLADSLSVGDAALRAAVMTVESASEVLESLGRVRGHRRAAEALSLLSPLRESPLESGSAARFREWGFPQPGLQRTWVDLDGFIARSDFDWEGRCVIGFADGLEKYARDADRDRSERYQESRLRPFGTVARWGWVDVAGTGLRLFRLLAPLLRHDGPFPARPVRW